MCSHGKTDYCEICITLMPPSPSPNGPAQEGKDQHGPDWLSDDQLADIDKLSAATSVPDSESAKAGLTSRVSDDGYHAAKVATDPAADPTTDELVDRGEQMAGYGYWRRSATR